MHFSSIMEFLFNYPELIFFICALVGSLYAAYRRMHRSSQISGASILLAYYSDSAELTPLHKGTVAGMRYFTLASFRHKKHIENPHSTAVLVRVELPFRTKIHLLGIPKNSNTVQLDPTHGKSIMEKVNLEGDYDNYFSLYAEKDSQVEARYVLDPAAMGFTVDFCKSHNWEIVKDELYFVQAASANAEGDTTSMWDDIERFVKEIRPAIETPLTPAQEKLRTPYGEDRRNDILCPLCSAKLVNQEEYFACPNNDGILALGSKLVMLRNGELTIPTHTPKRVRVRPQGRLKCPSCGHLMNHVPYNNSSTIIDSCTHCAYRWLDMGELMKYSQG